MRVPRCGGREHRISVAGTSPLSGPSWTNFEVEEGICMVLGWITDRAETEGSLVDSDSGGEGSKSSRERLAIL